MVSGKYVLNAVLGKYQCGFRNVCIEQKYFLSIHMEPFPLSVIYDCDILFIFNKTYIVSYANDNMPNSALQCIAKMKSTKN